MPRPSRMVPVLLLAAILATPAVLANPVGEACPRPSVFLASGPMDSITQLWHLLVRVWRKNGWQIDPDRAQTKNGGQMDPDGNKLHTPLPTVPNQDSNPSISSQN